MLQGTATFNAPEQPAYVLSDDIFCWAESLCFENNLLRPALQPSRLRAISTARNCIRGTATKILHRRCFCFADPFYCSNMEMM